MEDFIFTKDEIPKIADTILTIINSRLSGNQATVVGLTGELGAGKTTFSQTIAQKLGILDQVTSPTFVFMQSYMIPQSMRDKYTFEKLIHIDAYRFTYEHEVQVLDWQEITAQPKTLILVEWPEKIASYMPINTIWIDIQHKGEGIRSITIR